MKRLLPKALSMEEIGDKIHYSVQECIEISSLNPILCEALAVCVIQITGMKFLLCFLKQPSCSREGKGTKREDFVLKRLTWLF